MTENVFPFPLDRDSASAVALAETAMAKADDSFARAGVMLADAALALLIKSANHPDAAMDMIRDLGSYMVEQAQHIIKARGLDR